MGLSTAYLKSADYAHAGNAANADVRSGEPVTVTVRLNNPKELALAYTLGYAESLVEGTAVAPLDTASAADRITTVSFTFTPSEAAEHGEVEFTLGLRAPELNKTFAPATFTVRCDSPPEPLSNLVAGIRADGKACVGFALNEEYADADVSAVEITYTSTSAGTSRTVTESVSPTGTGLTAMPTPALLDSDVGAFVRYFLPDDVLPGNQYTFTVVPVDASGKKCQTSPSVSVIGDELYLGYNANGGTGSVAAKYGYNLTTSTKIAAGTSLSRPGFGFTGWNTKADGSGTAYAPNADFTFGSSSLMLYAQWQQFSSVAVSITTPGYEGVSVTQNGTTSTSITMDTDGTLPLSMSIPSGAINYRWDLNGTAKAVSPSYSFNPAENSITAGTYTITGTADYNGVSYSGSVTVTVTADYMVAILPYGKTASYVQTSWTYISDATAPSSFTHSLTRPFGMAKYEASYGLWSTVYAWATSNGYSIGSAGAAGYPAGSDNTMPVTGITFYDALVWCNAYSEMMGYTPCYYSSTWDRSSSAVMRNAASLAAIAENGDYHASSYTLWTANGYRLPTEGEWHYAASCGGYYAYNHVSGNTAAYVSSDSGTYTAYANASSDVTVPVRSLIPNIWGLYCMSGNVSEYCFDLYNAAPNAPKTDYACDTPASTEVYTVVCGGSFATDAGNTTVGNRQQVSIGSLTAGKGLRLARTITQ